MKPLNIVILISLLFWSCVENKSKNETIDYKKREQVLTKTEKDTTELTKEIKLEKRDSISKDIITNAPCIELKEFVFEIEKLNWISDTNRLKKAGIYTELEREKVTYFNDRPFYPISFEKSQLNKVYNTDIFKSHFDSLDFKLFKGVKNIWAYFYRDKKASDWVSDGVIEQWEFETESQADKALRQILQPGFIVYFNTNPYFCRIRNKLIIFQSRAMAFSYDQKILFEKFVKEKAPKTAYK